MYCMINTLQIQILKLVCKFAFLIKDLFFMVGLYFEELLCNYYHKRCDDYRLAKCMGFVPCIIYTVYL